VPCFFFFPIPVPPYPAQFVPLGRRSVSTVFTFFDADFFVLGSRLLSWLVFHHRGPMKEWLFQLPLRSCKCMTGLSFDALALRYFLLLINDLFFPAVYLLWRPRSPASCTGFRHTVALPYYPFFKSYRRLSPIDQTCNYTLFFHKPPGPRRIVLFCPVVNCHLCFIFPPTTLNFGDSQMPG